MPRDQRIRVRPELELRALIWGPDGLPPRFILVHGLASNARIWDGVAGRLADDGYAAVAVDQRGHGRSDKPDEGYDFDTVGDDLARLADAVGAQRPVFVGQSWGANVVLELAARRPEVAGGVVLVDGGLRDMREGFPTWEECWERLAPPRLVGTPLTQIEGYFRSAHADWPKEGMTGALANFDVRPDGTVAPWLTRERHRLILRELWAQRPSALFRELRVPAVVVLADDGSDWSAAKRPGADAARATLEECGVPVRVVTMAGDHDLQAQHPGAIASLLVAADRDGFFRPAAAAAGGAE